MQYDVERGELAIEGYAYIDRLALPSTGSVTVRCGTEEFTVDSRRLYEALKRLVGVDDAERR